MLSLSEKERAFNKRILSMRRDDFALFISAENVLFRAEAEKQNGRRTGKEDRSCSVV